MNTLFWLLFGHALGDFAFQSEFLANNKSKHWVFMFAHCFIWTGCIAMVFGLLHIPIHNWSILFLFSGHMLSDAWKGKLLEKYNVNTLLWIDQLWHFIQLMIVWACNSAV